MARTSSFIPGRRHWHQRSRIPDPTFELSLEGELLNFQGRCIFDINLSLLTIFASGQICRASFQTSFTVSRAKLGCLRNLIHVKRIKNRKMLLRISTPKSCGHGGYFIVGEVKLSFHTYEGYLWITRLICTLTRMPGDRVDIKM